MGRVCTILFVEALTYCLLASIRCGFSKLDIGPDLKWDACKEEEDYFKLNAFMKAYCVEGNITTHFCKPHTVCHACKIDPTVGIGVTGYAKCYLNADEQELCVPTLPAFVQVLDLSHSNYGGRLSVAGASITSLILARNQGQVRKGSLQGVHRVECVNMDHTLMDNVALTEVLALERLKRLSLRNSRLSYDMMSQGCIWNPTLNYLWLSGNNLGGPESYFGFFNRFPDLKGLDMEVTNIADFTAIHVSRSTLESVEILDFSGNSFKDFLSTARDKKGLQRLESYFPKLVKLDLSMNKIQKITHFLVLPSLTYLNLSGNYILAVEATSYFDSEWFPALRYLDLGSQLSERLVLDVNILRHPTLVELRLDNRNIEYKEGKVMFPNNVTKLERLTLNGSNLTLVDEQRFVAMFGHLRSLKTLSLSSSKLGFVSSRAVASWVNLTQLALSDNAISSIPDQCFDSLLYLAHLDLSGNKLTAVSEKTFGENLRAHLNFLDLGQNPFVCSCELFWFTQWFLLDHQLFNGSDPRYICRSKHETVPLGQFSITKQACLLSHDVNVLVIFSCSFVIVVLTAVTLLYRYRWHLRLLLYEAFRGRDDVRRRYLQHGHFAYDVFVSFDSENMPWVRQHLMPELERRLGLRLCVHERDFTPGRNIVDNIVECVQSSKKVLMLFSKHFVNSQWCQFELNFCLHHVMDYDDALIVACLDDVASREVTASMMAVLRTTTYLQWEDHGDATRAFWGRLTQALNEVMQQEERVV